MRVVMLAYHNVPKGPELKPGDVHDGFDDAEARRQISIGGARAQTAAELEADAKVAADAKDAADAAAAAAEAAKTKK